MDERTFKHALNQHLAEEVPTVNLWHSIEQALPSQNTPAIRHGLRLSRIVAALIIVAFSAAAVYAFYQGVVLPSDPGVTQLDESELLTMIGETQPVTGGEESSGLTVTLDYAYADLNRVIVGYTVNGTSPEGRRMMAYSNPTLMTGEGVALDRLFLLASEEEQTDATDDAQGGFSSRLTANFLPGDLALAEGEPLALQLMVDVAVSYLDSGEFPAPNMIMAGAAQFAFDVPAAGGIVVDAAQTASAESLDVELQRVVVSPSMTRLDFCAELPELEVPPGWSPMVRIAAGEVPLFQGQTETFGLPAAHEWNTACRGVVVPAALAGDAGEWTITIDAFHDVTGQYAEPIVGPWEFVVEIPAS